MSFLFNYFKKLPEDKRKLEAISFLAAIDNLKEKFPNVAKDIIQELKDQRSNLKLIASENYSSLSVQQAMGNLLTDKYSEGYVRHRFYAGCENVDNIEEIAINEAKDIFGCDHVYIQPHSGADANMVAFWSILVHKIENKEIKKLEKKSVMELTESEYEQIRQIMMKQKIVGMSLNSGGHLTHGYRMNISSKMMQAVCYEVDPNTHLIDYKVIADLVKKEKPLILLAGYSAYSRKINFAKMREIADSVGAVLMVDMAHFAGLVAGKVFIKEYDPVAYADIVTSTTHKTLRGPRGGLILCTEEYKEVIDKGCPLVLGGPMPHVMAAKAVAFKEANTKQFQNYAHQIVKNAFALSEELMKLGANILTNGTDNHLVMVDVNKSFNITGRQAESVLRESNLTVNRNSIPLDENGPWYTSGIRLGTAAITTLGMKEDEMKEIAKNIVDVLSNCTPTIVAKTNKPSRAKVKIDAKILEDNSLRVKNLLSKFLLYPELIID